MNFDTIDIHNKRTLLRVDLNVPLKNGSILNDFRLETIVPPIKSILAQDGSITLLTHLGRPIGVDALYSTSHLLPWFKKKGIPVVFAKNFEEAQHHIKEKSPVILFENLRFFEGEQSNNPEKRQLFCRKLAQLGDVFVNDAFGVLHRNDASITLLPLLFSEKKRTLGPLVTKELHALDMLKSPKNKPLICIIGGKKIATKLSTCAELSSIAQYLIIGPALSFICMRALGFYAGKSLVDVSQVSNAKKVLENIKTSQMKFYLPEDYQVTNESFPGKRLYTVSANAFPDEAVGVTIGPKSIKKIEKIIQSAGSIFYTGLIGSVETVSALSGTKQLFTAMKQSDSYSVIAGGDSVAAAQLLGINKGISHFSTGGSSSLIYLAKGNLLGLEPFIS